MHCARGPGQAYKSDVHAVSPEQPPLEADLARAQGDIAWAEHLVLVYPTCWGAFPARAADLLAVNQVPAS